MTSNASPSPRPASGRSARGQAETDAPIGTPPQITEIAEITADPWSLSPASPTSVWAWWHDGRSGRRFAAWGSAASLAVADGDRLAQASDWFARTCTPLRERDARFGEVATRAPSAIAALGFADAPMAGVWGDMPRAWMFVPRVVLLRDAQDDVTHVIARGRPLRLAELAPSPAAAAGILETTSAVVHDSHVAHVADIVDRIASGQAQKIVAARAADLAAPRGCRFSPQATARALVEAAPNATTFAFGWGGRAFVGATPERLATKDGLVLSTEAVAGTAADPANLFSDKETREHAWVVAALREGMTSLSERLWVGPTAARRAGTIHHLVTPMRAALAPGHGLLDVVRALHPTPALGGWPRDVAADHIARREPLVRGWYGGPVGWIDGRGDGSFDVAIRCALLAGERATAFAGGGIVAGSDPEREWQETQAKLAGLRGALRVVSAERAAERSVAADAQTEVAS